MGIPSFFPKHQYRRFEYQPRYYDEQKEELENRIRDIEEKMGVNQAGEYIPRIRRGVMKNYYRQKKRRLEKQSNIRLIVIIAVLLLVSYFMFFS
ncbi:MAG: hypothetical protein ACOCXW_02360 [Bacteroidota bacterium]